MKEEIVYVIVPFSRFKYLESVIKNFNQQTYKYKKLVIVENGSAIGCCEKSGFKPDVLLKSDNHQSHARNEALHWVRSNGGGMCANFDDDDYYGPEYLLELMQNIGKADVIGKYDFFVRSASGHVRLFDGVASNCYSSGVHGPTIATMAEKTPEYKSEMVWGEDSDLIERMKKSGSRVYATSKNNFMLNRRKVGHTWSVTDDQMVQTLYHGLGKDKCKLIIKDLGLESDHTLNVVNGVEKDFSFSVIKPRDVYEPEDSPAYVKLVEQNPTSFDEYIAQQINKK